MTEPYRRRQKGKVPRVFWKALDRLGLRPIAVLRAAGLPKSLLSEDMAFVDTPSLFALWATAETLSGDPTFGIKMAEETATERHMLAFLTASYAADFRDGLTRLARVKRLSSPERLEIVERDGLVFLSTLWPEGGGAEPNSLVDASLAMMVELGRRGTGLRLMPRVVEYARSHSITQAHHDFFGCRIRSSAACNTLVFDAVDLDRPFPGHNPEVLAMLDPGLAAALADLEQPNQTRSEVRALVTRALAGGRPDAAEIARAMGLSKRTLQRRMAAEGTTFREVVEEARHDLAQELLSDLSVSISEVACLLGYNKVNSFYRAFRLRQGTTPGAWRRAAALTPTHQTDARQITPSSSHEPA